MKNSFVLFTDKYEPLKMLSREQRGDLFLAIYAYECGDDLPEMDDMTKMLFMVFKGGLDQSNSKYEKTCERRREAGMKGGRPKKANGFSENQLVSEKANGFSEKHTDTDTKTDTESDTDTDTESDTEVPKGTRVLKVAKPQKHKYGEYQHVELTEEERQKLSEKYGESMTVKCIRHLDEYIEEKGYKSKSHYLTIMRWVVDAVKKEKEKNGTGNPFLDLYKETVGEL